MIGPFFCCEISKTWGTTKHVKKQTKVENFILHNQIWDNVTPMNELSFYHEALPLLWNLNILRYIKWGKAHLLNTEGEKDTFQWPKVFLCIFFNNRGVYKWSQIFVFSTRSARFESEKKATSTAFAHFWKSSSLPLSQLHSFVLVEWWGQWCVISGDQSIDACDYRPDQTSAIGAQPHIGRRRCHTSRLTST